jgi:predicted outer membrane repeat protein
MKRMPRIDRDGLRLLASVIVATLFSASAATAGVVGTGAGTCTQALLLTQIQAGGTVTFNCGAGAVSIPIQNLQIAAANPPTVVNGGGSITLDGTGNTTPMVVINASSSATPGITFQNIAFANGNASPSSGGAIYNGGTLTLSTVTFTNNKAPDGGAIYQVSCGLCILPSTAISYSTFANNQATTGNGGAIRVQDGSLQIRDTDFSLDTAPAGSGGAIYLGQGPAASRSLTVGNGHFSNSSAGAGNGGAIAAETSTTGTVGVDSSTFQGNTCSGAGSSGGAIYVDHTDLTVTGTLFKQNAANAGAYGGAASAGYGIVAVSDSTFDQNSSNSGGSGAVSLQAVIGATFRRCTFSANVAQNNGAGGAMVTSGPVGIENATFSGNSCPGASGYAGAIYVEAGPTDLRNVTVTANSAATRGGIYVAGGLAQTLTMRNSIVAGNTETSGPSANPDIAIGGGTFTSNGYNLIGSSNGITVAGTDIVNPSPNLGPLANNGGPNFGNVVVVGPTLTRLPNAGSPAIDAGNPAGCLALGGGALVTDQRNLTRPSPSGGRCDIGAVEVQAVSPAAKLAFVQQPPASVVAGAAIAPSVTVQLQDGASSPVSQAGVLITVGLASGTGTLSGTATQATDGSGLATFAGLSVNLIGTKSLSASSGVLAGPTSASFVITAGAAASIVVSSGGGQQTPVGTPFALPLQVTVTDGLGNPVPGASVTFTPPASGASAVVTGSPVTTNASGIASVTATANGTAGSYNVSASTGTLPPVTFALSNAQAVSSAIPALGVPGLVLLSLAIAGAGWFLSMRAR